MVIKSLAVLKSTFFRLQVMEKLYMNSDLGMKSLFFYMFRNCNSMIINTAESAYSKNTVKN